MDSKLTAAVRRKLAGRSRNPQFLSYFPAYLREPVTVRAGALARLWLCVLQMPVQAYILFVLRPRSKQPSEQDRGDVDSVYTREARGYDRKHHQTTRGQDLIWRRAAGRAVVEAAKRLGRAPKVLDLCTGTGLAVIEMLKALELHNLAADIIGLDYNKSMIGRAKNRRLASKGSRIAFLQGDATDFILRRAGSPVQLQAGTFDIATQVFGIGGIDEPIAAFRQTLAALREGGEYLIIDMHQPVRELPGEWPLFGRFIKTPELEAYTWLHTTLPLALARLWVWRDPTFDFYLAPLVCERNAEGCWGFEVVYRDIQSERWWFSLPVMPTGKLLMRKVRISEVKFEERVALLRHVTTP